MRSIRRFAFLSLVLLLTPVAASAGERSREILISQVDTVRILEILSRPWRLLRQNPETTLNKGGGTMDPNGNPVPGCDDWFDLGRILGLLDSNG